MGKRRRKRPRKQDEPGNPRPGKFDHRPFAKLELPDEDAPTAEVAPAAPPPPPPEPDDDADALARMMAGVAPLEVERELAPQEVRAREPLADLDDAELVMRELHDLVKGNVPFDFRDTDEHVEAAVQGLDRRIVRRLRRGDFSVQAHLDLHGYYRKEARAVVEEFVIESQAAGKRCVLIVHGRGKRSVDNVPVLKEKLAAWLTRGAIGRRVLAFTSARPWDGGTGAVYVLLRG